MKLEIVRKNRPHDDYHVFECRFGGKAAWKPGVHGEFMLPEKEIDGKKTRIFSIASICDEEKIIFATRIPDEPSSFKKHLAGLEEGDEIHMDGPFGEFNLRDETSPAVIIAGGVGITPVRAIFKELEKGNARPVKLIYSARGRHLFKNELCKIAEADPNIEIHFVGGREEVANLAGRYIDEFMNNAYYYISGPPGMVTAISMMLEDRFIYEARIIAEAFLGY